MRKKVTIPDHDTTTTVAAYDQSAKDYAEMFGKLPSVKDHIIRACTLAGVVPGQSRIVEIGCGDGRHAEDSLVSAAKNYLGFDPSIRTLELARARFGTDCKKRFPNTESIEFVQGFAQTMEYPEMTDIVVSIRSVQHLSEYSLQKTSSLVHKGLRKDGIFYILTPLGADERQEYQDTFGTRVFFYHSGATIGNAAGLAGFVLWEHEIVEGENGRNLGIFAFMKRHISGRARQSLHKK
ncbi:MAG TPA: class I SAM-dependent methyltransferase [Candidatus Paceibacterota bacterium]|nr:class I SAM-dependent methyltransferase [Candidatus Paceibacterota bacterium]